MTSDQNPSPIERIESGLLSYGGDNDDNTNPFEVRLGKYVDLHLPNEVVGIKALRELHAAGIKRHQLGVKLDNQSPQAGHLRWLKVYKDGEHVDEMTNGCWSPRAETVIGSILAGIDAHNRATVLRYIAIKTSMWVPCPNYRVTKQLNLRVRRGQILRSHTKQE